MTRPDMYLAAMAFVAAIVIGAAASVLLASIAPEVHYVPEDTYRNLNHNERTP